MPACVCCSEQPRLTAVCVALHRYETRDQANKAIGANGRIHDGYMLGVVWRSEAVRICVCRVCVRSMPHSHAAAGVAQDVNANQAGQDSAAGHHRLAQRRTPKTTLYVLDRTQACSTSRSGLTLVGGCRRSASTHLDSESIFKPRPRRKNVCTRMCEYLFKSSW